jgi:hypothetical protein
MFHCLYREVEKVKLHASFFFHKVEKKKKYFFSYTLKWRRLSFMLHCLYCEVGNVKLHDLLSVPLGGECEVTHFIFLYREVEKLNL